ncbi:MAG: hypothetical protein KBD83_04625 [Gammaproteobacteria bacterium]|nr:hypothetical protein [Gammaproteobacteria bacterium]
MKCSKVLLSLLAASTLTAGYASVDCELGAKCYFPGQVAGEKRDGDGNGTLVFFTVEETGDYLCKLSIDRNKLELKAAQARVYAGGDADLSTQVIKTGSSVTLPVTVKEGATGELKFRLAGDRVYPPNVVAVQCSGPKKNPQ